MSQKALLLLCALMPLAVFSQTFSSVDPVSAAGVVRVSEFTLAPRTLHPVATMARSRGEQPSAFSGVTYTLQPNVSRLSTSQVSSIGTRMPQDGLLDISGRPPFRPSADSIYFDPQSDLVFQPLPLDDNQMVVVRPGLSQVFQDIRFPRQVVPVRLANTSFTATDASGRQVGISASGAGESYAVNLKFDNTRFELKANNKDSLIMILTGEIVITNPRIDGQYSKNDGYAMIFKASEQINLKVETKMSFGRESEIPLWGTEIEAGNIGKCKLLLSMVLDVNGQINLNVHIDQGIDLALGATGGTYWYVPSSLNKVANIQHYCNIAYEVKTQMTAFAGIKAATKISIKGYNVLDMYVKAGMEGMVETTGNELLADIGYRVKSAGKIVSKKFTLVDHYTSLWKYQIANTAGFKMVVHEACAYGDFVAGQIQDINNRPYTGPLEIRIKHRDGITAAFIANTNAEGVFLQSGIPLKNGDKVSIKVPGSPSWSSEVAATIPFKEISLLSADYFSERAILMVAASKSERAKLAGSASAQRVIPAQVAGMAPGRDRAPAVAIASSGNIIDRINQFRQNLVVYSGPVTFWVRESENQRPRREDALQATITQNPMGMARIDGLNFKPGQWVQARIETEGFTITSAWVPSEGLMISPIEQMSLTTTTSLPTKTERYTSTGSFILVSSLEGTKSPSGQITLIKGFDSPHSPLANPVAVNHFPDARQAALWFNKTITLEPLAQHPGAALANTGPWESSVGYRNPDFVLPSKNGRHPFEKVSFTFKGKELGYSYFISQCQSCSSPAGVIENIGNNPAMRDNLINNPGVLAPTQTPSVRPQNIRNPAPGQPR